MTQDSPKIEKQKTEAVPKLRFREFEGEWRLLKLKDISSKISDGIHSTPKYDEKGEYYFINGNNLVDGTIRFFENTKRVTKEEAENHSRDLNSDTILLSINGTIGNLAYYQNEKVMLGKSACYIKLRNENQKNFIFNFLQLDKTKNYFNSELTGSTIKNLSLKAIKNLFVPNPSLPEQQKIASFLSAVDKKIQQLTRKKELLETYKKGVMQQLFSQEIRFKDEDGKDFPEWERQKISNFIEDYNYQSSVDNEFEVFTSSNKGLMKQSDYFGKNRLTVRNNKGFNILPPGYLTYRSRSDNRKFSFNENNLGATGIISTYYPVFKMTNGSNKFFLELTSFYQNYIGKYSVGTSQTVLSLNTLKKIKFNFPCNSEQQKLADFLSAIDKKKEVVSQQIEKTQTFKKGLLQQMFV